ncbi:hypothetical protein KIN20_010087 [Parelaphostrongylus tenuis]|uniref:TM2 domain-containing protein n=1 Tax=Parelaphostrongylus tenuis TaxID=148309 RepID=A0AAD5QL52_PARTN|nr:hypothetical protein KIN20_010087 [Parelaphostrongylus tenuis]
MSTQHDSEEVIVDTQLADALKARLLLMTGGLLGLHRFYLDQIPEAFIFISTGGVFLMGIVYDSFYISKHVDFYNMRKLGEVEEMKKYKNGKLLTNLSRMVPFSFLRFVASVVYAVWLGFLCWIAASVTSTRASSDNVFMISALAAAVTTGVYIVGNCGRETRNLIYMWIGSFSTTFIYLRFIEKCFMRAILFAAVISTWLGNRTARIRTPLNRPFTWKHLLFWTSLFGMLMGVIAVGATRHIFHRQVMASVHSQANVTTSVGTLLYDRFMDQQRAYKFFKNRPVLSFGPLSSNRKSAWIDGDFLEKGPDWADMMAVFIVDLLYQEARVLEKRSKIEPLKWALWRMYLITKFETSTFVSHEDLRGICARWVRDQAKPRQKLDPYERVNRTRD